MFNNYSGNNKGNLVLLSPAWPVGPLWVPGQPKEGNLLPFAVPSPTLILDQTSAGINYNPSSTMGWLCVSHT